MATVSQMTALLMLMTASALAAEPVGERAAIYPGVRTYLEKRAAEFDQIPAERKATLGKLADYVKMQTAAGKPMRLTFICTHNSRRSHLSQIWAATAAEFYGISRVETYSGGTEATAFNPRAIAAIERAGLKVEKTDAAKNTKYAVRFRETGNPLLCFSKVYNEAPNPKSDFCAVMTCSQADKSCPIVAGSALRVAIPFEDPKVSDDTPQEAATYDERCQQICREIMFVFSLAKN